MNPSLEDPTARVTELNATYSQANACAAHLLCDRHSSRSIAFTLVAPDLSSVDIRYGELHLDSERLAAALRARGVGPGDRLATLMGKSREYLVAVLAIWRLGAVHVPLFTAFAAPAIAFRLTASRAKCVFCDAAQRPKLSEDDMPRGAGWTIVTTGSCEAGDLSLEQLIASAEPGLPAVAVGGGAPIIQIFTSGTTGSPKSVLVPLRALASFQIYAEYGLTVRAEDVYWNAADPGWAYGLYYAILAPLAMGVRSVLLQAGFSAETTYGVLARYRVTNFAAAPTVYRALRASGLSVPPDLGLRCASSAGEPLTPDVNQWAGATLGVEVHDHFGQTEAGMIINNHHHPVVARPLRPGSMGHPMPGWSAAILKRDRDEPAAAGEAGRVAVDLSQSPLAWFQGYEGEPGKSAERVSGDQRWYYTGDTGHMDADGYFYFSARDDDVIIMAGYRIGPFEVESVLATHSSVAECAVVARPDATRGEVLEAFVVLRPGCQPSDGLTGDLQNLVKRRYAAHAYPRRIHYVESLPKTPSGKIQRFVLRESR